MPHTIHNKTSPFFCIVTPVYNPVLESLKLLVSEIRTQTFADFIHVMISNGPSEAITPYAHELNNADRRFIYLELDYENIKTPEEILANLGKRRNHVLKNFPAQRYLFADADLKIIRKDYLEKLYRCHVETGKDIILTQVHYIVVSHRKVVTLPVFPIKKSCIDIANITISRRIAEKYGYPTNYNPQFDLANDYRLFITAATEENTIIMNFISAVKNGNSRYKSFMRMTDENRSRKIVFR